jgi:hypothetical protein
MPEPVQIPLTCVMPIRSPESYEALVRLLPQAKPLIDAALAEIGTVHFARFVFLHDNTELAIITTFDGPFERYISDFAHYIGDVFDKVFQHIKDPPPHPVNKNTAAFIEWVRQHDVPHSGFFSAYPRSKVIDITSAAEPVATKIAS